MGISPLRGPVGKLGSVLVCRDLCELWKRAFLSMGALQTTLGRGLFTRNSERSLQGGLRGGKSLSMGALWRELEGGGGVSLTGDPAGYAEEGYVDRGLSTGDPFVETGGGGLICRDFMRQVSLYIGPPWGTCGGGASIRNVENLLKEGSGYGASLSMGTLLGEPGGGEPLH
jgi:hypothetical protein